MESKHAQATAPFEGNHLICQVTGLFSFLWICWRSLLRPASPRASQKFRRCTEPRTSPLRACAVCATTRPAASSRYPGCIRNRPCTTWHVQRDRARRQTCPHRGPAPPGKNGSKTVRCGGRNPEGYREVMSGLLSLVLGSIYLAENAVRSADLKLITSGRRPTARDAACSATSS